MDLERTCILFKASTTSFFYCDVQFELADLDMLIVVCRCYLLQILIPYYSEAYLHVQNNNSEKDITSFLMSSGESNLKFDKPEHTLLPDFFFGRVASNIITCKRGDDAGLA